MEEAQMTLDDDSSVLQKLTEKYSDAFECFGSSLASFVQGLPNNMESDHS
jgi:hypothetical protein